jgi:hypothetical protein
MLWQPDGKRGTENVNVHIWDFAGHVITHAAHQFFLSERCTYIIVYDGRTEGRNQLEYWLDHVKNYGGASCVFVLVNLRDTHTPKIPENRLRSKYGDMVVGFSYFSIQDDQKELAAFRKEVAAYIVGNPSWNNVKIGANYFKVKQRLEELFAKKDIGEALEYINRDRFASIAQECGVADDESESLLRALNAFGICLWYPQISNLDTLVLNPEWTSHGIYKIINWVNEQKEYSLPLRDFSKVFKDEAARYPADRHDYLFKLMKIYELAYEERDERRLVIPALMDADQPNALTPFNECLMMKYVSDQPLPPDSITRFIVRRYQEIKNRAEVWRYGVILHNNSNTALVQQEQDRTITVRVDGGDPSAYIDSLRTTLDEIFTVYKSRKPDLQYRVDVLDTRLKLNREKWVRDAEIKSLVSHGLDYQDNVTGQKIPTLQILHQYNITTIYAEKYYKENSSDMSRTNIFNGENTQYTEQAERVTQVNNNQQSKINFPASINEQQYTELLSLLDAFLESDKSDDIAAKDYKKLTTLRDEAKKEGKEKGWAKFRNFFSDASNIIAVATPLVGFIKANQTQIADWIKTLFTSIHP